jgi:hypothetical protein
MDATTGALVDVILIAHLAAAAWVTARAGWGRTPEGTRRPQPIGTLALILMSATGLLQVVRILRGW